MSERMTELLASWHADRASYCGASREWHMRAETHVKDQDAKITALADVGEEMLGALVLLERGDPRAAAAIAQSAGRIAEALRLVGRL